MNREKEYIDKLIGELTPERRRHLNEAFRVMKNTEENWQPEMKQMSFGGYVSFDSNRKQVELNGEFSKEDLFRIALVLND